MQTLIIYDNTGYIYLQMTGTENRIPQGGLQYLEVEIPKGKQIKSIDRSVSPNIAIYTDIPLSETEILKQKVAEQEAAIG